MGLGWAGLDCSVLAWHGFARLGSVRFVPIPLWMAWLFVWVVIWGGEWDCGGDEEEEIGV